MRLNTSLPSFSSSSSGRLTWQMIVLLTLAFWLGGSLLLDLVIMPGMYAAGMMAAPNFATAGYSIFWIFNRVELVCAATILTGVFALSHYFQANQLNRWAIALAGVMLAIALVATYWLTPEMSALGIHLSESEAVEAAPVAMNLMHGGYFALDFLKVVLGSVLAGICVRSFVIDNESNDNVPA
ncbi:MAG: DUF4149 domain-containing protein [Cyanobacteria bacterium P01_A01_bin.37]